MSLGRSFYYVYVLQNNAGDWYTGCTSDLKKRLKQHLDGKSLYTKHRGPYELIYYEACLNSKDAFHREKYLKTGMGKRYLNNRIKVNLEEQEVNPVRTQITHDNYISIEPKTAVLPLDNSGRLSGF